MFNEMVRLVPRAKMIVGRVAVSGGTPTIEYSSLEDVDQAQLSIVDTGAGDYNIVVTNFKGPRGVAFGFGTATTISLMIGCTAQTYSGETATFTFKVEDDASAATDNAGFNFILFAL